jgi:serine/threonine protein kinase
VNDSDSDCGRLEQAAQEFVERFRRGERPALSEYTRRCPDLATEIRELFPALVMLEGVRPGETVPGPGRGPDSAAAPPRQLGDYRILREVGRGGMGIVYEAEHGALGRRVAIKVLPAPLLLDSRYLERFQREARAAAKLHHTNIVPVFGVGEQDGLHYYVMQFIDGQGLDSVLVGLAQHARAVHPATKAKHETQTSRRLSLTGATVPGAVAPHADEENPAPNGARLAGESHAAPPRFGASHPDDGRAYWHSVARIGMQVAEALASAHAQGTLHRDIKPSNLLLDSQGTVWVTDFGLAKAAGSDDLTHSGDIVGTLRYMAPERFRGKGDARSDVYALGLTLYELLALRPAFDESEYNALLYQVAHVEPPPLRQWRPSVPRDLETIVLKAIARDPERRYPSAGELADDLRRFTDDRPIRARAVNPAERLWRWCRRNPWPSCLLLMILLTAGVGFWHLSRLSAALVRFSALQGAALQSEVLDEVNDFYSAHVVDRAKDAGIEASEHFATVPGTIPTPATFTIELGRQISNRSQHGMAVHLYSDFPFPSRTGGGPRDAFEKDALERLRDRPDEPYYRFEEYKGRPTLRYASARRMTETCVNCHNSHPDSPRRDWHVGDVRGVLEIIRPLDKDVEQTRAGLQGSFLLVAGLGAAFVVVFGVVFYAGKRRWPQAPSR